jgi:hypothetical protein
MRAKMRKKERKKDVIQFKKNGIKKEEENKESKNIDTYKE